MATKKQLERHPLSETYGPPLSEDELRGLAEDLAQHGQHDPIILYEGKVLAGWNRYMGCLQKGLTPVTKEYKGDTPEAVAFGTNVIRRRMSSLQKAMLGAQYSLNTGTKQIDVSKLCAVSLNKLNQCCQLLKTDTPEAVRAVRKIRETPDMTPVVFEELLLDLGIGKKKAPAAAAADDDLGGDDDDATGGAIDALLGLDDEDLPEPTSKRAPIGNADPIGDTGTKRSTSATRANETTLSRVAKAFNGLSADEQRQFVVSTWKKLRAGLDAAVLSGAIEYASPEKAKPATDGIGDVAAALTGKKKPPAPKVVPIARRKKAVA